MKETVGVDLLNAGITGIDLDLCGPHVKGATEAFPGDPCVGRTTQGGLSGQANAAASQSGTGMTVTAASVAGRPITFAQNGDVVRVTFPSPSQAGQRVTFTLEYHGVPATGLSIGVNKYQDRSFVSNDWPNLAHNWLATIDHISMKASITMIVTAPARYQVISNGLLKQQTDLPNGLRRTVWDEKAPIPTWQFALAAAPYAVDHFGEYRGIALSSWVFPQERDNGYKGFSEPTQSILEFFIDRVGPYSYEKLAHVQANFVSGGMELASSIFYGYNGVPRRQLVAHEMAHQWFGNSASESDWDHVWLSEGFATYLPFSTRSIRTAVTHSSTGSGTARRTRCGTRWRIRSPRSFTRTSRISVRSSPTTRRSIRVELRCCTCCGACSERRRFGKASGSITAASRIETLPATTFAGQCRTRALPARTAQTKAKRCGGSSTSGCTAEAFCRSPVRWSYDAAAKQLRVSIAQTQKQGLFRMPIEIGITLPPPPSPAPGSVQTAPPRIMVDKEHNEVVIPMESAPLDVKLDPNSWVTLMQGALIRK